MKKLIEVLSNNPQATIIASGLIVAGFLFGGIYTTEVGVKGLVLYRANRFTGAVEQCVFNKGCSDMGESAPIPNPATPTVD